VANVTPGCYDAAAVVTVRMLFGWDPGTDCPTRYDRASLGQCPNDDQTAAAQNRPCWAQPCTNPGPMIADHQPPLSLVWAMGGCLYPDLFYQWAHHPDSTPLSHCQAHSNAQGLDIANNFSGDPAASAQNFLMAMAII